MKHFNFTNHEQDFLIDANMYKLHSERKWICFSSKTVLYMCDLNMTTYTEMMITGKKSFSTLIRWWKGSNSEAPIGPCLHTAVASTRNSHIINGKNTLDDIFYFSISTPSFSKFTKCTTHHRQNIRNPCCGKTD